MRERVLQNSDDAAREQAGQRTTPRRRKSNRDQERQIEYPNEWQPDRQKRLQNQRSEWNEDRRRNTEAIDFNLLARGIGNGHVSVGLPERPVAASLRSRASPV